MTMKSFHAMDEKTLHSVQKQQVVKGLWQAALLGLVAVVLALSVNHFRLEGIPLMADWSPEARLTQR